MKSFFSSPKAKQEIEELYQIKLDELSIDHEFMIVETSFGDTNIIVTGKTEHPPLVLLHGANGCAPIALEALISLAENYRVYAVDIVGQPNLSDEVRPNMKDDSYGQWMYEIMTRLNLRNATLVGISFGGFISWKTLIFDEKRIANTFLIVPAGIVNGNPVKTWWNIFMPIFLFRQKKIEKYLHRFLDVLFTEKDKFAVQFLSKVFLHFEMDFSPVPLIKKDEAKKITTPVHFIIAKNDLLFPGIKMQKRIRKIFPSLGRVLMLETSKHVPSAADNKKIIELIKSI